MSVPQHSMFGAQTQPGLTQTKQTRTRGGVGFKFPLTFSYRARVAAVTTASCVGMWPVLLLYTDCPEKRGRWSNVMGIAVIRWRQTALVGFVAEYHGTAVSCGWCVHRGRLGANEVTITRLEYSKTYVLANCHHVTFK